MEFKVCFLFLIIVISAVQTYGARCTYYGSPSEYGSQTANGEYFNPMGMTCSASSYLPFGTVLLVTNQRTGRSITVRVNDRYGVSPRTDSLDLSYGAFGHLAHHNQGVFPCSYQVLY